MRLASRRTLRFRKTGNKLKVGWTKIVDKMKSKKAKKKKVKKMEQELVMRIMAIQENDDEPSSREGSIHSLHDSDRVRLPTPVTIYQSAAAAAAVVATTWHIHCHSVSLAPHLQEDSDLESYLASVEEDMMEFKLSYEMWRVGRWAVSIPLVRYKYQWRRGMRNVKGKGLCWKKHLVFRQHVNIWVGVCLGLQASWEADQLTFTVHLEEKDSPENLQWDIKKTYMDIVYFRNRWQVNVLRWGARKKKN